ncbi:hypothetical protein, partial [Klebsiella aerogenes]|uniref:hypothetical protein n=1 Tax=Klebsiella aerogenes TaxID=548 RepID=UPI001CC5853C
RPALEVSLFFMASHVPSFTVPSYLHYLVFIRDCGKQTEDMGCEYCGNERALRIRAQQDREDSQAEVRKLRHMMYACLPRASA